MVVARWESFTDWDKLRKLYETYESTQKIADELGENRYQVCALLHHIGLKANDPSYDKISTEELIKEWESKKYWYGSHIAKKYGANSQAINKRLKELGYKTSLSLVERYDVPRMIELYEQDHSTQEVAVEFNVTRSVIDRCFKAVGYKARSCYETTRMLREQGKLDHIVWFPDSSRYLKIQKGLKFSDGIVPMEFIQQFDFDTLMLLNPLLPKNKAVKSRYHSDYPYRIKTCQEYQELFLQLSSSDNFKKQMQIYKQFPDEDKRLKSQHVPSLDHKQPLKTYPKDDYEEAWSKENLHIMSWFENRGKGDMNLEEYADCVGIYFGNEAKQIVCERYNIEFTPVPAELDPVGFLFEDEDTKNEHE